VKEMSRVEKTSKVSSAGVTVALFSVPTGRKPMADLL
jgi:hypothetical protein